MFSVKLLAMLFFAAHDVTPWVINKDGLLQAHCEPGMKKCAQGQGDCDDDNDCQPGLKCGKSWWTIITFGTHYCVAGPDTKNYELTEWYGWSECSQFCGGKGKQGRTRECIPAENGGYPCPEKFTIWLPHTPFNYVQYSKTYYQTQTCNNGPCQKGPDGDNYKWNKESSNDCDYGQRITDEDECDKAGTELRLQKANVWADYDPMYPEGCFYYMNTDGKFPRRKGYHFNPGTNKEAVPEGHLLICKETCSDGIQNHGEDKVDCGGPCDDKCLETETFYSKEGERCGYEGWTQGHGYVGWKKYGMCGQGLRCEDKYGNIEALNPGGTCTPIE